MAAAVLLPSLPLFVPKVPDHMWRDAPEPSSDAAAMLLSEGTTDDAMLVHCPLQLQVNLATAETAKAVPLTAPCAVPVHELKVRCTSHSAPAVPNV
jgi:hypothetical protein